MAARFSQLRELARQFSAGQVARDEYRRERSALLDRIATGKTAVEYREITPPKPSSPPTVIIDVGDDEPGSHRFAIFASAVLLLVLVGSGGIWYLRTETAAPAPLVNVAPKAAAVAAVEEFLLTDDWSSAGISAFEQRWTALTPEERALAVNDPVYGRLERELRSRIDDQLSLVGMDQSGQAQGEVTRLRSFGQRIGVPVP